MRSMQILDRIDAIDERARRLNLSLREVCLGAKVEYSTVWRWRSGECSPIVSTFDKVVGRLEGELVRREAKLRSDLGRFV